MNSQKAKKPRKRWKVIVRRIILLLLLLVVLAGGAWYGYDLLKQEYTVTYNAYTATIGSISNSLSFTGSLQLVDSATYTASAATSVRTVYVKEGDRVKDGDKLMRLANGETISAEFDGRVNQVYVKKDDNVTPGANLVQVADFDHMKINFRVDEYDINDVAVGVACQVTATATERKFNTTISSINYVSSSTGNVAYYTATAYVDIDQPGVYPGMQVNVTVPQEQAENVVVLKADALSFTPRNSAFVYQDDEDGGMKQVPVEVGVSNGNYVEIRSGVKAGDIVYSVAEKTARQTGLAGMMSSMFGSTRRNMPTNNNNNRQRNNNNGNYGNWGGGSGGGMARPGN